jgi:3-oxoacyl-[acyl-carrier-protein] synthase-3
VATQIDHVGVCLISTAASRESMYSTITGTGRYLPTQVLTNDEIARRIDTSDEWIRSMTGIRQRHIAAPDEQASDMALHASREAMSAAGVAAADLDLIIAATITPDMVFPSTAALLQARLGARHVGAFDLSAACSGFVYGVTLADAMVSKGAARHVLVVGAEKMSRLLDWNDRSTCVLFGDGAGAAIISASTRPGIRTAHVHADGSQPAVLNCAPSLGSPYIHMEGGIVFRFAVRGMVEAAEEALAAADARSDDIAWFIPHQANLRIIETAARKLGIPRERVVISVDRHANTSAASIPLALDEAVRDGRIKAGQQVMLIAVGGGFTWGAVLIRWT